MTEPIIQQDSTDTLVVPVPPAMALGSRGALTAATIRIRTPSSPMPPEDAAHPAALDPVDTTVAAPAVAGSETVTLTSAADVTPGRVIAFGLGGDAGRQLLATVESVAGNVVRLVEPVPVALAQGDLVKGWSVSRALTLDETKGKGRGLAIVKATIGGVEYEFPFRFRVEPHAARYTLTPEKLLAVYPDLSAMKAPYDGDIKKAIHAAWTDLLFVDLARRGLHPERIHATDLVEVAHRAAVRLHLLRLSANASIEEIEEAGAFYSDRLDAIVEGKRWEYDAANNLTPPDDEVPDPTGSFIGFTR